MLRNCCDCTFIALPCRSVRDCIDIHISLHTVRYRPSWKNRFSIARR